MRSAPIVILCAMLMLFVAVVVSLSIWQSRVAPVTPPSITGGEDPSAPSGLQGRVKNLILVIGDGMGPQQIGLLTTYAHQAPHSIYNGEQTAIERAMDAGVVGLVRTNPHDAIVVDSAAAATQLATGALAGSEMIGLDRDGSPVRSLLERARDAGKSTGVVTDTRLTHATPAAFVAHQTHRSKENEIAVEMLEAGVDVMLGGGLRHWIPAAVNDTSGTTYQEVRQQIADSYSISSKRKDNRNLLVEARGKGYSLAFNNRQLSQIGGAPALGVFGNVSLPDALQRRTAIEPADRALPTLKEMTEKAVELLSSNDNGFFLMVEAGQIDWACHNSDAGTALHEMLALDATLKSLLDWVKLRDDTLLVITADHETGSFGFSYSGRGIPIAQKLPGAAFAGVDYRPNFNFGNAALLDGLYDQSQSFYTIFRQFDALPEDQQTPQQLQELVRAALPFPITTAEAEAILTRGPNPIFNEGHPYLGSKSSPKIGDYAEFFVYGDNLRMNLLGRALAKDQNVVWGTGTHTATPVVVVAVGPNNATKPFGRMMHATQLGKTMRAALLPD